MDVLEFIRKISERKISTIERAVAVIWYHYYFANNNGVGIKEISNFIEQAGCAKQNVTNLKEYLRRDGRVLKRAGEKYIIRPDAVSQLNDKYLQITKSKQIIKSDAVIDNDLFNNAKGYIKNVVLQLNASYHYSLFDCCAVMCRRLLETLIIETYEALKRSDEIKDHDDYYLMFSGLLSYLENDNQINVSRNTLKGLKAFKKLGDLSSHNRRFNARQLDIDRIRDDLRISCEELLHLAKQSPS